MNCASDFAEVLGTGLLVTAVIGSERSGSVRRPGSLIARSRAGSMVQQQAFAVG